MAWFWKGHHVFPLYIHTHTWLTAFFSLLSFSRAGGKKVFDTAFFFYLDGS